MPTFSSTLPSFPLMPPSKLHFRRSINNIHIFNLGATSTSPLLSRLQVRVDDVQDPLKINHFGESVDGRAKRRYAHDDEYLVRQNFLVRLYELDIHQKASLEALLNYTEETGLNLFQSLGLVVGGFGVSKEMSNRNLIWVIGRMHVEVNSYPTWGDIVQVETWCSALGKHSTTCSSKLTDAKTGKRIMRVDSEFMMINEKTRRLSKIPEEIKSRGEPYVKIDFDAAYKDYTIKKLQKLDKEKLVFIQRGIKPLWFDLDPNKHVNNVKYISWILEGAPERVREREEVAAITLEYRRECGRDNVLHSLSSASIDNPQEFDHLLCLDNGTTEVARATTLWRPKSIN